MIDKSTEDCNRSKFTLDQPLTYQVKIAGQPSENWSDWINEMDFQIEADATGLTTTTLTGTVDQAALIGPLHQFYYLGFPLITINCVQPKEKKNN